MSSDGSMPKRRPVAFCLAFFAVILLVLGCVLLFGFPYVIKNMYNKETTLASNSKIYSHWKSPSDAPLYMRYYFFNVTNSYDVIHNNAKPIVNQTGVLSYREVQNKFNLTYSPYGSVSVAYLNNHTYIFDEATSEIKETDVITTPNFPLWTIMNSVSTGSVVRSQLVDLLNEMANSTNETEQNAVSPLYQVEVGDLLWGYHDNPFMATLHEIYSGIPTKFGLQQNNSIDGLHEVFTGVEHHNKNRGLHKSWNGSQSLPYWNSEYCNKINGSDGSIFPTFMTGTDKVYIFNTDLCRSVYLVEESKESIEGIATSKFSAPSTVFNVSFEDNICYCSQDGVCTNGLLDVSKCFTLKMSDTVPSVPMFGISLNVSLIMSSPHFLYADNDTINSVIGLKPDKEKHETSINIQLQTGIALKASKKIQVNTLLYNGDHTNQLDSFKNLTDGWTQLMPIFWAEERLDVDKRTTKELKDGVFTPMELANYISYFCVALAICCLLISLTLFICCPLSYRTVSVDYSNDADDRNSLVPPTPPSRHLTVNTEDSQQA